MRNMHSQMQIDSAKPTGQFVFSTFELQRGFTLIELLVVIAIISAVTIATVPMILPALDVRRIREATRIVSTHFASAQSEAIASGRPAGVWIERLPGVGSQASMDLFSCEVPAPYAGDSSSKAKATDTAGVYSFQILDSMGNADAAEYGITAKMISGGDLIQFNYRGPWFRISEDPAKNDLDTSGTIPIVKISCNTRTAGIVIEPVSLAGAKLPPTGTGTPFKIQRRPVRSAGSPVQLPAGAAIDLFYSGSISASTTGYFGSSPTGPILLLFNKSGGVSDLYLGGTRYEITSPVYFLVGKRSKLPAQGFNANDDEQTQSEKHNFRDTENIWVSINPQTGLVTTAECAVPKSASTTLDDQVKDSRVFATSAQAMGGR